MKEYKSDLIKGGAMMGAAMGLASIIGTTVTGTSLNSLSIATSILSIGAILAFPIIMGKKYKATLADDVLFGFGGAYKYSFYMMMIGSLISTVIGIITIYIIGTDVIAGRAAAAIVKSFLTLGITTPKEELSKILDSYNGYNWILQAFRNAVFSAAFFALISALIIRKREK